MIKFKDYNELKQIVWIPTIPRSRSSMTAGILVRCGAFCGNIAYGFHNGKGLYENPIIMHSCWYDRIESCGGVKGLAKLEKLNNIPENKEFGNMFTALMNYQGYQKDQTVMFKHAPFMFFHKEIMDHFPNSIWIIPDRNKDERVISMMNLWNISQEEVEEIDEMYSSILDNISNLYKDKVYRLDTDVIAKERRFANIENIVHKIPGLSWDQEKVEKWISTNKSRNKKPRNTSRGFWI
tara:strand:- start:1507 stop:2217 length:711 start_codon:yes stop_codon:yes gene_type:complete